MMNGSSWFSDLMNVGKGHMSFVLELIVRLTVLQVVENQGPWMQASLAPASLEDSDIDAEGALQPNSQRDLARMTVACGCYLSSMMDFLQSKRHMLQHMHSRLY